MSDWKDLTSLEEDEEVINTFGGGLEHGWSGKAKSGTLILTSQNLTFCQKRKGVIFTTPLENIISVQRGKTHHKSVIISLEHVGSVKFFTKDNNDASANALCRLIIKQKSRARKQQVATVQDHPSVREIIKEKEVIVKVRCQYCRNIFDETLDRCPHCGGRA